MDNAANPAPRIGSNRPIGKLVAAALLFAAAATTAAGQARIEQKQPREVQKLDVSRMLSLDTGEARSLDLSAAPGPQIITVDFSSSKGAVSVYVFRDEDVKGDEGLLTSDPSRALAGARAMAAVIKAEVPEKTAFRVIVRGAAQETAIELRISNQLGLSPTEARIKKLEEENATLKQELADLQKLFKKSLKEPIRKK